MPCPPTPVPRWALFAAALLYLQLPCAARADEANAKLVRAKLAYDQLGAAKSADERLAMLSEIESALSSIVHDDPGSDLAVKLVSGEKVAGLSWDNIRVQLDQLRTFSATENSLFYFVSSNGTHSMCWNYDRLFCGSAKESFDRDGVFIAQDMQAGLLPTKAIIAQRDRSSTRTLEAEDHALADYVFRYQPITLRSEVQLRDSTPSTTMPFDTAFFVTYTPLQRSTKPIAVDGTNLPYASRTLTRTIRDDNPAHYFPAPNGEKSKSMSETQYYLPTLSMSAIPAADFDVIRAGNFATGRLDGVDALFTFFAGLVNPAAKNVNRVAQLSCLIGQIKELPPVPAELQQLADRFIGAPDPIQTIKDWSGSLDRAAGAKLLESIQSHYQPALTACNFSVDWR